MEILKNIILSAVVIDCCLVFYCKGVALTLGDIPTNVYVQNEQSLDIECILPSGNLDSTVLRNWDKDGVTVVNGGAPVNSGSGYSETLQSDRFILTTPKLNYSFDGTQYKCTYRFSQASVIVKIADIGTTDQSKGDCIDGKSIEKCWFSLSKVLPVITTQSNLTVSYEDDTVENINSALNTTAQLNADGNTWAYYFRIEQNSILKEVKAITLSFEAGPFTRVLTINSIKDTNMNASTIVPSNSTTSATNSSHDMGKILWISIRVGALLIMVVVAVIIVMKCVSAQHKKTLQESSVSQTSQAKELEFTNKIHRESA